MITDLREESLGKPLSKFWAPKMPPEPPSLLEEEEKAEKNIAVIENNTIISVRQMKQIKYSGIYTFFFYHINNI